MKRAIVAAAAAGALGLIAGNALIAPRIYYNATPSAPVGWYWLEHRRVAVGDYALIAPPASMRPLIDERRYAPFGAPLLKRIAASKGDQVCRHGAAIAINGERVAEALDVDSEGRPLPSWRGCVTLAEGQIFVLNAPKRSFDGRYFGPSLRTAVLGAAEPL